MVGCWLRLGNTTRKMCKKGAKDDWKVLGLSDWQDGAAMN